MATEWNEGAIVGGAIVATVAALARLIIGWWRHQEGGTSILITQEEKHFGYYQTQLADARTRIKDLEEEGHELRAKARRVDDAEYKLRDMAYHTAQLDAIARDNQRRLVELGISVDHIPPPPRWIRDIIVEREKEKGKEPGK